jgi:hypothetical protein
MRSKKEIKTEMTASFMNNELLAIRYGFVQGAVFETEFSLLSLENIWFDLMSFSIFLLEQIFDTHKKEVATIIEERFPHRPSWYRTKALEFQYGYNLIEDSDRYDNSLLTAEQIATSRIVKYAAVTTNAGRLFIKIAKEVGGILSPITLAEKNAFDAYIDEIADCGVKYTVINNLPDELLLTLQIFRDPLVLNAQGMSILNGNFPVEDAILEYMKELPFNGELVLFDLERKIKTVDGVRIPNIVNAETRVYDNSTLAYLPAQPITVKTVPVSGYFVIPNFDTISYVV